MTAAFTKIHRTALFISLFAFVAQAEKVCEHASMPAGLQVEDWQYSSSSLISYMSPYHMAQDSIGVEGYDAQIHAKFSYGVLSADLGWESVEIWLDDCGNEMRLLGRVDTDEYGQISYPISADLLPSEGRYAIRLRVVADDSFTQTTLRVYRQATQVVVFDLDGTLTNGKSETAIDMVEYLTGCTMSTCCRADAAELTSYWKQTRRVEPIYLTGRHYMISNFTRTWLKDKKFAPGSLVFPLATIDAFPVNESVGEFKGQYLIYLQSLGLEIKAVYGDASTDLYAFDLANIPRSKVCMVGCQFEDCGVQVVEDSYKSHLSFLSAGI